METNVNFDYLRYLSESSDAKSIVQELMTTYGKDVWNYAFSMTRKRDQADDITQEVFLKVYRNIHTFRCESSVKTWLLAITRNMVLDYKKSAFLRKVTLLEYITNQGEHASAEQVVMEKMTVNEVWEQVLKLPAKYREVLILFAHYQLTMQEMAEVLGVSVGTVKSRLYHARNKISTMKESHSVGSEGH